jgi:hypothetical protein
MKVVEARQRTPASRDEAVAKILRDVSRENLRAFVDMLAFPRHFFADKRGNRRARDLLLQQTAKFGYTPRLQGTYDNIIITSPAPAIGPFILLGAHYDSVPGTPGADDNASAVAVCLECARLVRVHNIASVMIVFFNREEDGLIGSSEFVAHLAQQTAWRIKEAHVFEMVGYCDRAHGSQKLPPGLPVRLVRNTGDFLGLIANSGSNAIAEDLLALAACYVPQFPVAALKVYLGMEKFFGHLTRSDHAPFWKAGIPSLMWTDTSEFRNPHYHRPSDTPDTLDYDFMGEVVKLVLARVVSSTPAHHMRPGS